MMNNKVFIGFSCLLGASFCDLALSFAHASTGRQARHETKASQPTSDRMRLRMPEPLYAEATSDSTESEMSLESQMYFDLLQDAIDRNSTEASGELLSMLTELRQSGAGDQEAVVNNLLAMGPDSRLPFWTVLRPLARFSRRTRLRSLRRTIDKITPASNSEDPSAEFKLQRRRRALVSLLRSLSAEGTMEESGRPAIVELEKKAILASKESSADLTTRRPEGLETPDYEVIASGNDSGTKLAKNVEIRRYQPYSVCSVSMGQPRPKDASKTDQKLGAPELKGASSFGALAGYLFGKNDQSTAMKMTTPVFTTPTSAEANNDDDDDENNRQMEFVLPSNYWGTGKLTAAPKPLEGSGVRLEEKASEERAVLMFGGYASKKETTKRQKQLLASLSKQPQWKVIENTQILAQYNDPFTVPWKRLNEVSVKVTMQEEN